MFGGGDDPPDRSDHLGGGASRGGVIATGKKKTDRVLLYTDGACTGNPGPGGWGAVLVHSSTGRRREISGAVADTTNNRMELIAVIEGLRLLRRPADVDVYSDSRYVVQGMNEWIDNWIKRQQRG